MGILAKWDHFTYKFVSNIIKRNEIFMMTKQNS